MILSCFAFRLKISFLTASSNVSQIQKFDSSSAMFGLMLANTSIASATESFRNFDSKKSEISL